MRGNFIDAVESIIKEWHSPATLARVLSMSPWWVTEIVLTFLEDLLIAFPSISWGVGSVASLTHRMTRFVESLFLRLKSSNPSQICSPVPSTSKLPKSSENPRIDYFQALATPIDLTSEGASQKDKSFRKRSGDTLFSKRLLSSLKVRDLRLLAMSW